jgi:hypothetical protein
VSFHYSGPFTNAKAQERWSFYSLTGAPSNVYDGHYNYTYSINENAINSSGTRQIHMLEMSLSKSIEGSTLSFSGSVKNLESHSFSGFVLVFVAENQLVDPSYPTITWNFVFRAYGLNKTLVLAGLSTDTFSNTWNIPSGVNATNIQVIAATYDSDERDLLNGWPYAVQSVCDVCGRSVAVPEFPDMWAWLFVITSASMAIVLLARKTLRTNKMKPA